MTAITNNLLHARLGRYEIFERIGAGGMARVFKGRDLNLDRTVAIKVLHEHLADDPTFKQRFEREAKFIASFNHPNIVQIYDYDMVENDDGGIICYMVMPYVPGQTLKALQDDLAKRGEKLPHARVAQIILSMCDALAYAHVRGMVHRDVKPGNILFNERNEAVLADFGIARLAEGSQLTQESTTVGTPAYMAPEQVSGSDVDGRADLYSLGVILYELLAGQPPFKDDGSVAVMLRHLTESVPRVSQFLDEHNAELDAVILKALAKNPADRYETAELFAAELRAALGLAAPQNLTPMQVSTQKAAVNPPSASTSLTAQRLIQRARQVSQSPMRMLGAGVAAIALVVIIALVGRGGFSMGTVSPTAVPQTSVVESMTGSNAQSGVVDSMTGDTSFYFMSSFDPDDPFNELWPRVETGIITQRLLPDGTYNVRNELPRAAHATLFDTTYTYTAGTIVAVGTLRDESSRSSAYGIIFNYLDDNNYNVFAVDGVGRFSIWRRDTGVWRELRSIEEQWTPNDAVNPRGESNWLTITYSSSQLTGFVNNVPVVELILDTQQQWMGSIGIYTATPEQGIADVVIDSYQMTTTTPSMTSP